MRRLSQKRLLRLASLILTGLTVVFGILWVVRGLRPAIACGVLDYVGSGDWSAAFACVDQADYEALLFVVGLAASAVTWLASRGAPDTPLGEYHPTPREQANNRKGMIDRVWAIWIEGHLAQTLYQTVLMSLGMTLRPAALRPGSVRLRRSGEQERPVLEHESTVQLFDEAGHTLLILGEPGSGKTTMLLDLARSLLARAREDESTPIPVVFNLSSLTDPEQSLDDWLVGEFHSSYDVPEKVARYWLAHNELALLLDGLDEVRADRRAGVAEKIDQYRAQHMDPWLAVYCRRNEYAELVAGEAAVEGVDAVVLEPLAEGQIKGYLADLTGDEPKRLWRALQDDSVLLELADTPLMLNVMLLAAEQLDWSALPSDQGRDAVRSHIYDAYIRGMLARFRNTGTRYPDDKTLRWLHWLAGKMVIHGQAVFLLERLKRSWFNRSWQRFVWILMFGLILGLFSRQILGWGFELFFMPSIGLLFGLFLGSLMGLADLNVRERIHLRPDRRLLAVLPYFGLFFVLLFGLLWGLIAAMSTGLFLWLLDLPLNRSTAFEQDYRERQPNAALHLSLRNGLILGLILGLLYSLFFGLLFGLIFELSGELILGLSSALSGALSLGLFFGLIFGLFAGLDVAIKHYTLRLVLFLDGSMPLCYVRFLDYCVDRVLLRRVGGGYMFIHRTIMEHIAGLDLEKWKDRVE